MLQKTPHTKFNTNTSTNTNTNAQTQTHKRLHKQEHKQEHKQFQLILNPLQSLKRVAAPAQNRLLLDIALWGFIGHSPLIIPLGAPL
jgi:hypothetical protein